MAKLYGLDDNIIQKAIKYKALVETAIESKDSSDEFKRSLLVYQLKHKVNYRYFLEGICAINKLLISLPKILKQYL